MQDNSVNIYMEARLSAGMSRERAAELLYISTRSLADYELGERVPPNDVVARMVDLYASPWLAIRHLRAFGQVATAIIPEVSEVPFPVAVLDLLSAIDTFSASRQDLIQIARDGRVDDLERVRFEDIVDSLGPVIAAAIALRCYGRIGG